MLEFARHRVETLPRISVNTVLSAGTIATLTWLLLQNRIPPTVIYMLQVYLTF